MTLKWTPEEYPENDTGCLSGSKKTKEKGSTFTPLYNGNEDSYVIDSIGYYWFIGVLERNTTSAGVAKFINGYRVSSLPPKSPS